jgi:hypothetical protein
MHKNNVKKYHPRSLELYNTLPFKTKLKLGPQFNQKELHKFFDELNKQEDELVLRDDLNDEFSHETKDEFQNSLKDLSDESDVESDTDEVKINLEPKPLAKSKPRSPDLPFHMKLRDKKVKFSA